MIEKNREVRYKNKYYFIQIIGKAWDSLWMIKIM